jgi:ABC-type hemin transport system ATPase subunit
VRSLVDLAIDNAREGCVGEAYAALAAVVQARCASSADLRAHYAAIAVDELGHAALAHAIDRWIYTRLTDEERDRVAIARAAALAMLHPPADTPVMRALGLPTGALAAQLLATVERTRDLHPS